MVVINELGLTKESLSSREFQISSENFEELRVISLYGEAVMKNLQPEFGSRSRKWIL